MTEKCVRYWAYSRTANRVMDCTRDQVKDSSEVVMTGPRWSVTLQSYNPVSVAVSVIRDHVRDGVRA